MESERDHRGAVLASREARECLLSVNELLVREEALRAGSGGELSITASKRRIMAIRPKAYELTMSDRPLRTDVVR